MAGIDIGIAGCGIAGLASALLLHRQGHQVTLYERFDEPRPLGSGLMVQPTGLAVLSQLGLAQRVWDLGSPVTRLFGRNENGKKVLDARYSDLPVAGAVGIGIHRSSLFATLFDAVVSEGIRINTEQEIVGSKLRGKGRCLIMADGRRSPIHDLLVDSLGIHTELAPETGKWLPYGALWGSFDWPGDSALDRSLLEQRYRAARQMVGVLPIGTPPGEARLKAGFFWSMRADALEGWKSAGLAAWKAEVMRLWPDCGPILDQISSMDQLAFARYAHRTLPQPLDDRLIHIGDSWHSASPQLGQGANMALLDAWALAEGMQMDAPLDQRFARAVSLRKGHIQLYQGLTALFTPVYQSDARWPSFLRDHVLTPLSRIWPGGAIQAFLISGLFGAPLDRLKLPMPDYERLAGP